MSYSNWSTYTFEDVCNCRTGKLNSNAAVDDGKYTFFTCAPKPLKTNTYSFDQDAILLAGNNANGVFHMNRFTGKFDAYQRTYVIHSKRQDVINNEFIYYALKLQLGDLQSRSLGSATKFLTMKILNKLEFKVPADYIEMSSIANILSSLDDKIELNNKINKNLEEIAQALYKQWFVDFEFPNENGEPYKSSGGEMIESELGLIPKGWEVKSFADFLDISTTSIKPQNKPKILFEHFSLPAFDSGRKALYEYGVSIKSNKYKVYSDSILLSKLNPSNNRTWLPFIESDNPVCSTEYINYRPLYNGIRNFIYTYLSSKLFIQFISGLVTGSTNSHQRLKPRTTLDYKISLPVDFELIRRFDNITHDIYVNINKNILENEKLGNSRDILLPKLMSGEIEVPIEG